RLLAFRDGVTGLRELRFSDAADQRQWQKTNVGLADPQTVNVINGIEIDVIGPDGLPFPPPKRVNPHPFELLSAEHITVQALSNPATRSDWSGQPKQANFTDEQVNNLY